MKTYKYLYLLPVCTMLTACSNDDGLNEVVVTKDTAVKQINVTLPSLDYDNSATRTVYTINETGMSVTWAENDTIGIFPSNGHQVSFSTDEGIGGNTVTFNGGGWGLKNDSTYAAYFPFSKENFNRSNKTILLDYTGQRQVGNANADHLKAFDYLASGSVTPENGSLNLDLKRLGSIVKLDLTLPSDIPVSHDGYRFSGILTLSSDVPFIQKAELDISGAEPRIVPLETSRVMMVELMGMNVNEDKSISVFFMLAPGNYLSATVGVSIYGNMYNINSSYGNAENSLTNVKNGGINFDLCSSYLSLKNLEAGKPYQISAVMESISQYDLIVNNYQMQKVLLENWDFNHDGLFSKEEAAQVTSIGTVFAGLQGIEDPTLNIVGTPFPFTYINLEDFSGLTSIDAGAFKDCVTLKRFILPPNVVSIGAEAFSGCTSLDFFVEELAESLTEIGDYAFYNCKKLLIELPNSVTSIGDYAFYNCGTSYPQGTKFNFRLPDNLVSIGQYAFAYSYYIKGELIIPESVMNIEEGAFYENLGGNKNPITVVWPARIKRIEPWVFFNCTMKSIVIPEGVEYIGEGAFRRCGMMTEIHIPESVTYIGDGAFGLMYNLTSINIPEALTSINDRTFEECNALTEITIPDNITKIGNSAFRMCSSLTQIVIPDAVESIGENAFSDCSSLADVTIGSNVTELGNYIFNSCTSLTSIIIPNGVKKIGNYTFYRDNLKTIIIGEGVTSIGSSAFLNLNSLESITVLAETPPAIDFYSYYLFPLGDCPIYVPAASVEAYKNANGWKDHADKIQAIL